MTRVIIVVRELNRQKPDYYLPFELPEAPRVGDYISVFRPDSDTHTEDVIVRHVWWHLYSPEDGKHVNNGDPKVGNIRDLIVECDVALGPHARDSWRKWAAAAKARGAEVVEFEVERFTVPESDHKS